MGDLSGLGSGTAGFGSGIWGFGTGSPMPDTPGRTPGRTPGHGPGAARTLSVSIDHTGLNQSSMLSLSPLQSPSPLVERDTSSPLWRAPTRNQETPGKGWEDKA